MMLHWVASVKEDNVYTAAFILLRYQTNTLGKVGGQQQVYDVFSLQRISIATPISTSLSQFMPH